MKTDRSMRMITSMALAPTSNMAGRSQQLKWYVPVRLVLGYFPPCRDRGRCAHGVGFDDKRARHAETSSGKPNLCYPDLEPLRPGWYRIWPLAVLAPRICMPDLCPWGWKSGGPSCQTFLPPSSQERPRRWLFRNFD